MIDAIVAVIFGYFLISHGGYLLLNVAAWIGLRRVDQARILTELPHLHSGLEPPISILLTTQGNADQIVASIRTALALNYAQSEVIVVNDRSHDDTMQTLIDTFELLPFPEAYRIQIPSQSINTIYRSIRYPNLRLIDKVAGGRADALNAAINAARYPLLCTIDANVAPTPDSLHHIVMPFLGNIDTVASIGAVQLMDADGNTSLLSRLQKMQHLRAGQYAMLGWSSINNLVIAEHGVHLLRKDVVVEAGGYNVEAVCEETELIMRMHQLLRRKNQRYRITFVDDAIGSITIATDLTAVNTASVKHQQGLADAFHRNSALFVSGSLQSRLAFCFIALCEWIGPAIEAASYVFLFLALITGLVAADTFIAFFAMAIGLGILLSMSSLLLEEYVAHARPSSHRNSQMIIAAVAENLGMRQLQAYWRVIGLLKKV